MTAATHLMDIPKVTRPKAASVPLPAPVVASAPVLIGDCVSPLSGETMLSLLWKRMDRQDKPDG